MILNWFTRSLRLRLVTVLLLTLSVLVVPALIIVFTVSHYQSEKAISAHIDAELGRTKLDTVRAIRGFFGPLVDVTNVLGSAASINPAAIREGSFNEVLYRTVENDEHLLSISVTLKEGFVRNLARITEDMRKRYPEYPKEALWVSNTGIKGNVSSPEVCEQVFYGEFPKVVAVAHLSRLPDFLETEGYLDAERTGHVAIGDVHVGLASGIPIVSVAMPMKVQGEFIGAVSASVAVSALSEFLNQNRISENSESLILDDKRHVVAASDLDPSTAESGVLSSAKLSALERRVMAVDALGPVRDSDVLTHSYSATLDGTEYSISDFPIDDTFGLKYRALIITPLNDFIGELRRSSRNFSIAVIILLLIEGLLIITVARRMSRRINYLSETLAGIRGMHFEDGPTMLPPPPVHEIAELQHGILLLQSALRSFALYVPLGVVRKLVEEGRAIEPGVEKREMTILFCDLENFSTLAQRVSAEELLQYTTTYFSVATEAITRNAGTVDKFIGDAVMSFWGAPQQAEDHAVKACRAALDIVRGMERANRVWESQGQHQLRVRVGINTASVLVGNIGSPDRLSYTAIGDGVNIASRLESKNKELGSTICISDSTYELAKDHIVVRPLQPVSVKGRVGEFMVYELLDTIESSELDLRVGQT